MVFQHVVHHIMLLVKFQELVVKYALAMRRQPHFIPDPR